METLALGHAPRRLQAPGAVNVADYLDGSSGVRFDGINEQDRSGIHVSYAGDVNMDGFLDLLIGAYFADPDGVSNAGESYLIFGNAALDTAGFFNLSDVAASNGALGVRIDGEFSGDQSGWRVASAGDVVRDLARQG